MQCFQRATDLKSRFSFTDGTGLRWLRNTAYMFAERSIDPLVAKKLVTHCLRRTLSTPTSETLEIQALLPYLLPDTTTPLNACLLDPDADFSSLSRMTSATVHRCDPVTVLKVKRCSGLLLQMVLIHAHPIHNAGHLPPWSSLRMKLLSRWRGPFWQRVLRQGLQ